MIQDSETLHSLHPWRYLTDDQGNILEDEGYRTIVDAKGRPIFKEIDGAEDQDSLLAIDAPIMLRVLSKLLDNPSQEARGLAREIIKRHQY